MKVLVIAAMAAALFVGCEGQTLSPTNVTSSGATLNARVKCSFASYGEYYFEMRTFDTGNPWFQQGAKRQFQCGSTPSQWVNISQQTTTSVCCGNAYEYRIAADLNPQGHGDPGTHVWADSNGDAGGEDYTLFLASP